MLMTKKELYTSPEVDVLEIKIEGVICQSIGGETIDPGSIDDWGVFPSPIPTNIFGL